jgi:hypothetical protein
MRSKKNCINEAKNEADIIKRTDKGDINSEVPATFTKSLILRFRPITLLRIN